MKNQFIATTIVILLIGITIAPSINQSVVKASSDKSFIETITKKQLSDSLKFHLNLPNQGLYFYVSPYNIIIKKPRLLRDWSDKPFPNTTAMYIGGGIGILPSLNISVTLSTEVPDFPRKIDVYSDGEYYNTLYPEPWGPISVRLYILFYNEKGFHSYK